MQRWILKGLITLLLPLIAQATDAGPTGPSGPIGSIEFENSRNGTITFSGLPQRMAHLSKLKTKLHDLDYLGKLTPSEGNLPYFVFTGKPCASCKDEKNVYLIRPGMKKPDAFVYPGRITDPKARGELLFEARAFFGKCHPGSQSEVYLVHQREKVDRRRGLQASVFIAEPQDTYIKEDLREKSLPRLKDIQARVKAKSCKEIAGWTRPMLAKPLHLKPRHEASDDEEDEEADKDSDKDSEEDSDAPAR